MEFIPAYYFPTTLVCVDDVELTLDSYKILFANSFRCLFYKDGQSALDFFANYTSPLNEVNFLNKVSEFEADSFNTQSVLQLDIAKCIKLAKLKNKHEEVSVLLSDFHMAPGMDGIELCKSLKQHKMKKMLLTENQTYNAAREALNSGVIDYFANKTDPVEYIKEAVQNLAVNFFCRKTAEFIKYLETNSNSPLTDQVFIKYFTQLIAKYNITEYYLIDNNGSYLLINAKGTKYILVVHNEESLAEFLDILREYDELDKFVSAVGQKQLIPFLGIGKEISAINVACMDKHLYPATVLNGNQLYYLHLLEYTGEI